MINMNKRYRVRVKEVKVKVIEIRDEDGGYRIYRIGKGVVGGYVVTEFVDCAPVPYEELLSVGYGIDDALDGAKSALDDEEFGERPNPIQPIIRYYIRKLRRLKNGIEKEEDKEWKC